MCTLRLKRAAFIRRRMSADLSSQPGSQHCANRIIQCINLLGRLLFPAATRHCSKLQKRVQRILPPRLPRGREDQRIRASAPVTVEAIEGPSPVLTGPNLVLTSAPLRLVSTPFPRGRHHA